MTQVERWNPDQYNRFRGERMQPFFDLVEMIRPNQDMRVMDLGCGTGQLTAMLAERMPNARVEGVDASADMLGQAAAYAGERVRFRQVDIAALDDYSEFDLVFSNAALQWVPDHEGLMARMLSTLRPGAQLAVQAPKNDEFPSHRIAIDMASESPYAEMLGGYTRWNHTLPMERYAQLFYAHGFREHVCIEKIYGHELPRSLDVVEWVKGTSLNAYLSRLPGADGERFLADYTQRLIESIGDHAPYFYPFRRLLFWGIKGG